MSSIAVLECHILWQIDCLDVKIWSVFLRKLENYSFNWVNNTRPNILLIISSFGVDQRGRKTILASKLSISNTIKYSQLLDCLELNYSIVWLLWIHQTVYLILNFQNRVQKLLLLAFNIATDSNMKTLRCTPLEVN